ncbi:hypothetical protein ACO22_06951 [Paracoccidioides brasiliensis]|nr:hypothetical protein ACO22_06951 [Paracoccidioides brasiliensis]
MEEGCALLKKGLQQGFGGNLAGGIEKHQRHLIDCCLSIQHHHSIHQHHSTLSTPPPSAFGSSIYYRSSLFHLDPTAKYRPSSLPIMSLRIVPPAANATQTSNTASASHLSKGAPSATGIHDTLRASFTPAPTLQQQRTPTSTHPLEARLLQWRQTHDAMKMETLKRVYGIAEPVRRGMELKIVQEGQWKPAVLGGGKESNIHADILALGGRETEVTWEDVFDGDDLREPATFHDEMEQRLKMNW